MTVYRPDQRPDVEVLVDDTWYPGELRAWQQRDDGWWANVNWSTGPGLTYLDTVPADRVRPAEPTGRATSSDTSSKSAR